MNKKITSLLTLAATLVAPALAYAGQRSSMEVYVDTTSRYAYGAFASAYNSSDGKQRIECWLTNYTVVGYPLGGCMAYDAKDQSAWCFFDDPLLADAVAGFTSDADVYFSWDDKSNCTAVQTRPSSMWSPKQ